MTCLLSSFFKWPRFRRDTVFEHKDRIFYFAGPLTPQSKNGTVDFFVNANISVKSRRYVNQPFKWIRGPDGLVHRRRMGTEAKAKVVASIWGAKFAQFRVVLPQSIWKKRLNSRNSTNSAPPKTDATTIASLTILLLWLVSWNNGV